ncbi:outer membrane protein [Erythrobacter mangrovi]|uniref:Outer membrane beta-barrel protein n=1 Tax=Erythrobacter mangrovi TaxID=2739433 RepID=A0A7D4BVI5_9SPHN|nr:outer membrane beta-barrel protein [Erythrobacter mangrovi]QKG71487.1 outer membrane beta-barrel protein [Erythrobacter mangrovi]
MRKVAFTAVALAAAVAFPTAVQAQDAVPGNGFVGVSAGYHDLGFSDEIDDVAPGANVDDSSPILGVFAGYDVPIGSNLFIGAEANYSFGTDALDGEYGASARLGFRVPGGTKVYARAGYQEINVDYNEIINDDSIDFSGIDDTDGDYLVGLGIDIPFGKAFIRGNVDTIAFDTTRATVGVGLRF